MRTKYFDRQGRFSSDCAKCALNNFIGEKKYSNKEMEAICKQLSPNFLNPHKSLFGGDYDVNVLIIALQDHGMDIRWVKKNENIQQIMKSKQFKGFFVNFMKKQQFWHRILDQSGRHWSCMRQVPEQNNDYGYFDSELDYPIVQTFKDASTRIQNYLQDNHTVLMIFPKQQQGVKSQINTK